MEALRGDDSKENADVKKLDLNKIIGSIECDTDPVIFQRCFTLLQSTLAMSSTARKRAGGFVQGMDRDSLNVLTKMVEAIAKEAINGGASEQHAHLAFLLLNEHANSVTASRESSPSDGKKVKGKAKAKCKGKDIHKQKAKARIKTRGKTKGTKGRKDSAMGNSKGGSNKIGLKLASKAKGKGKKGSDDGVFVTVTKAKRKRQNKRKGSGDQSVSWK